MDQSLRHLVRERALRRCEYCRLPEQYDLLPFQVDHVIAEKHRGPTHESNLALTCYNCNGHKGSNIAGRDPEGEALTALFHPRQDEWREHFEWRGAELHGRTPIGRTTIDVLNINDRDRVELRKMLIALGLFLSADF